MDRRFGDSVDNFSIVSYQLRGVDEYLKSNNISTDKKFIVVGDPTINGSLVFLNRFGWTYRNFHRGSESLIDNLQFADYMLILNPSQNPVPKDIKEKINLEKVWSFRENHVYALK